MRNTSQLENALNIALQLNPHERLFLIEQVAASLHQATPPEPENEHWGQRLVALVESMDLPEWNDTEDAETWVRQLRHNQSSRWDDME
jgi:hypothetical protein